MTPFRIMLGINSRIRDNPDVRELLESELVTLFDADQEELREQARKNIEKKIK